MPNGQLLTNEEVERCFQELGWRWLPGPRPGFWVLPVWNPEQNRGEMVIVDNGQGNPNFIGARLQIVRATRNEDCVRKALCLTNGTLDLVKLYMDEDRDVFARVVVPRFKEMFHRQMLRHALGVVVAGAAFVLPILQCCLEDEHCDVEAALSSRLAGIPGARKMN